METSQNTLYRQVVRVTQQYLGPAADRFISRQVQNHLHKQPEEMRVAISMVTEDSKLVEEYVSRLKALTVNQQGVRK